MSYQWVLIAYTSILCVSSTYFHKTTSPPLLILIGILYIAAHLLEKRMLVSTLLQMVLLIIFHKLSAMDLCLPLYLIQMGKQFYSIRKIYFASAFSMLSSPALIRILRLTACSL